MYVDEHGASLHFSDGHFEASQGNVLHESGLMQQMLPDRDDGDSHATVAAPSGLLAHGLLLKNFLASPDAQEALEVGKLVEYLQECLLVVQGYTQRGTHACCVPCCGLCSGAR